MERVILGLTERVTIIGANGEKEVTARIDTGATASSIDISLAEELGLNATVDRFKIVKSASGTKKRSVVMVKIKLNGAVIEEDFTLAERSHMTYPILIGQNILKKGNFLIDPNK
ncbi:MAG: RimK/LysX family protein [Nanoarchaeota archaeon]|nr:RimK/LysX family protein [Nanoarchaeota archaeon]MBU1622253.1 RimK/LysX family protein [Nanoarchaeota archaeon]MBU1974734.1 RimK/LysX family protein [Nanoarchaeota archaeon]